jgi:hypothetical protein
MENEAFYEQVQREQQQREQQQRERRSKNIVSIVRATVIIALLLIFISNADGGWTTVGTFILIVVTWAVGVIGDLLPTIPAILIFCLFIWPACKKLGTLVDKIEQKLDKDLQQ